MAAPSTYSQPNQITLGSLTYVIDGRIQRAPAAEFAVGLRMGSPDYDNREGAFFRDYNDFTGGLGVRIGDPRDFPDRFWGSRDVRTWNSAGDVTLAPLLTEFTLGAIVPSYPASAPGPGAGWAVALDGSQNITLYGAMGDKVFKTTDTSSPAFTAITPSGAAHGMQTFALVAHTNPTDLTDRGLFWATGSSDDIWKRNLGAGTWSQPASGAKADDLIVFDNKLLKVYAGQVSISADGGATWVDIIKVESFANFAPFWAGIGLDAFGQLMPYLVCAGKLYAVDVWTYQAVEIQVGLPSSITAATVWQDGEVVVTDGYYVKAYSTQRPVKDMGFNRDNGTQALAFIRGFQVIAGKYLVANVDIGSNLLNLYLWDGNGWHVVTASDAIFGPFGLWPNPGHRNMAFYNGASAYSPSQTLFLATYYNGRPWMYLMQTDAFKNPQLNGNHEYSGSGWIDTPWFDGGFSEMSGIAIEVEVHGIFTNTETLEVKYRTDNSTSAFTSLGTTSGTTTVQRFRFGTVAGQGISFKNIQFEFALARGSTKTATPVVRAIVFKFLKVPRLRSQYAFVIDVPASARLQGVTEQTIIDAVYGLVDDTPLTQFSYTQNSTVWVRFTALPREDAPKQDGTYITSRLHVTVEEPV